MISIKKPKPIFRTKQKSDILQFISLCKEFRSRKMALEKCCHRQPFFQTKAAKSLILGTINSYSFLNKSKVLQLHLKCEPKKMLLVQNMTIVKK